MLYLCALILSDCSYEKVFVLRSRLVGHSQLRLVLGALPLAAFVATLSLATGRSAAHSRRHRVCIFVGKLVGGSTRTSAAPKQIFADFLVCGLCTFERGDFVGGTRRFFPIPELCRLAAAHRRTYCQYPLL